VASSNVYNRLFFLELSVNLFAYLGSIAAFIAIAVPVFTGFYDDKSEAELSQIISENSSVCFNLIFSFTSLVNMSPAVSGMAGVTHRLIQFLLNMHEH